MYVREVRIGNVRHLRDIHLGPLPPPGARSDVIVLAGPNGGGKSTILELLSVGMSSTWGFSYNARRQFGAASFELGFGLTPTDVQFAEEYAPRDAQSAELIPILKEKRCFHRGFGFAGGEYDKDPNLNDRLHRFMAASLQDRFGALFLRSDRYYDQKSYNRGKIFDSASRRGRAHLRNMAFNLTDQQYSDLMDFFIEEAYNYPRSLGLHALKGSAAPAPPDPLQHYNELFQRLYPQYRLAQPSEQLTDQLFITLPTGEDVPFTHLSSGEQEVFFLLSFFLRNDISNSMVFIDEPEMHLHPELVRKMMQIMRSIRPGNQVWLATHNAELIEEAGRDKTYFVTRDGPTAPGHAVRATDADSLVALLRTMFGYSGFVGLAHRLVFWRVTRQARTAESSSICFPIRRTRSGLFRLIAATMPSG